MQRKMIQLTILFSLIIHIVFIGVSRFDYMSKKSLVKSKAVEKKVSIVKIKNSQSRQIVQTTDSNKKEPIEKSFLGEKNNTFDRQTKAKVIEKFRDSQANGKSLTEEAKKQQSPKSKGGRKVLANLGIGLPDTNDLMKYENNVIKKSDEQFLKEVSALASSNNDYVEDVPLSDITRFNTTEYRHYGFFQRIRNQLELHWGAVLKDKAKKIYKSGRKISSESDFITNVEVFLDQSGKITGMKIIGTSGIQELDDAAIESFNKAGPFPNPPKDLISNGIAVIKWGFVVKS